MDKTRPHIVITISAGPEPSITYESNIESAAQIQQLMELNAVNALRILGFGAGRSPESSGEKVIIDRLRRLSDGRRPLTVFDVGANKGQFLGLVQSRLAGLPFRLHAFEPGRETFRDLNENARGYDNVTLVNCALGGKTGEAVLYYPRTGAGTASLYKRRLDHFGVEFSLSENVTVTSLDDYCREHGVEEIDLLKLDVEGHELDVLHGGSGMFGEKRIRMVSFEFGGCNIDSRTFFQDFYYFFTENGFNRIFRVASDGYLAPVRQYRELYEQFCTTNYLAIRDVDSLRNTTT